MCQLPIGAGKPPRERARGVWNGGQGAGEIGWESCRGMDLHWILPLFHCLSAHFLLDVHYRNHGSTSRSGGKDRFELQVTLIMVSHQQGTTYFSQRPAYRCPLSMYHLFLHIKDNIKVSDSPPLGHRYTYTDEMAFHHHDCSMTHN